MQRHSLSARAARFRRRHRSSDCRPFQRARKDAARVRVHRPDRRRRRHRRGSHVDYTRRDYRRADHRCARPAGQAGRRVRAGLQGDAQDGGQMRHHVDAAARRSPPRWGRQRPGRGDEELQTGAVWRTRRFPRSSRYRADRAGRGRRRRGLETTAEIKRPPRALESADFTVTMEVKSGEGRLPADAAALRGAVAAAVGAAVAAVLDVDGCFDYGGPRCRRSPVQHVDADTARTARRGGGG